ncbi:MAG TPA: endonuclease/exonuclease/phosphatase family protein [Desulfobacterales bacterium]|nr:endonuclease/exonuclease/phosphatase family protein [Desulfobacterales bacterium]
MKRTSTTILALVLSAVAAVSAAAAPLTVLSYNLGLLRVVGSDFVPIVRDRAEAAPAALARFARERSADVLVLQEIWTNRQAVAITEALAPLGYAVVRPRGGTLIGKEGGLLVAVRAPLRVTEWSFTPFGKSTFMDSLARKGILAAVLENPGNEARFALLATHTVALDTDQGAPIDAKQVAAHAVQVGKIVEVLRRISADGTIPALIVGDFNVGPGYAEANHRLFADLPGMREAGAVAAPGEPLVTWDPGNPLVAYGRYPNEPAAKIDHVFFRDGGSWRWSASRVEVVFTGPADGLSMVPSKGAAPVPTPLSDHYGLFATLDLAAAR